MSGLSTRDIEDVGAAEVLVGFDVRAVGDQRPAVPHADGRGGVLALQGMP
ncbi:hypothetical protein ABZ863_22700 [Saccharomonospora sp. NPDC046836]